MYPKNIAQLLKEQPIGEKIKLGAWVRTFRSNRFIALNDGSTIHNLQAVVNFESFDDKLLKKITTGTALEVSGQVIESLGSGQKIEIQVEDFKVLGEANADEYPLQPKKHSFEFLREIAHLRPRTNTFSAIFRLRHALSFAIHKYFNDKGFFYMHTPIITASDAEGAGEMFQVTTLDLNDVPKTDDGSVDFKEDFFGKATNLTVSGQLEAELGALALSKVYTFGPTFRAENSNTTRHLAEFWMIEPEMAFYDITDNMQLVEDFLKYLIKYVLDNCVDDLIFLENRLLEAEKNLKKEEKSTWTLREKLQLIVEKPFVKITYTEAIDILKNSKPNKKKKFQYLIEGFGADLQSEHERFLVEKHFQSPVILYNYPKEIKAFYMRQNEDGSTVAAMDVLFPGIGEIVGGSQREERHEVLVQKMKDFEINPDDMKWYLDTRKFGSVPHSGFGLGFERLVLFVSGMTNIRDVIPFPRTPQNAEF